MAAEGDSGPAAAAPAPANPEEASWSVARLKQA
eukprot:SAG22_NODE_8207_length_674_cov_2.386087_1_plen_32_part_10